MIFTAGIGENHARGRGSGACEGLEFLGVKLDHEQQCQTCPRPGGPAFPPTTARVQVWVIPTNEELAIARDTLELTRK